MGGGGWRGQPQWPPPFRVQRWHLQPAGALATAPPPACAPDRYRYDPADPAPAVGSTSIMSADPRDNRALERRPDVLTYTSAPVRPRAPDPLQVSNGAHPGTPTTPAPASRWSPRPRSARPSR